MCGVFYIDDDTLHGIQKIVKEIDQSIYCTYHSGDIHPTDPAPVIVSGERGMRLTAQRWGYPGVQGKGVIFNARTESVFEKRMFQNGIRYHRAVIPAAHFYEWNANREKNIFSRRDGKAMYLAGFYDMRNNEKRFVILTTVANASMQKVHERMPLVLEENQIENWLYRAEETEYLVKQVPVLLDRRSEFEQMTLF